MSINVKAGNNGAAATREAGAAGPAPLAPSPMIPSALRLFVSLLAIIFINEFFVMWVLAEFFFMPIDAIEFLTDSTLLSALSAPFLWALIVRPLRSIALTERKRAEAVMEHVVEGVVSADEQGIILSFNPAAQEIFGYAADELVGQHIEVLIPEAVAGLNLLPVVREKSSRIIRDLPARRKDGSQYPMDLSVSEINLDGSPLYIGIMRDISDRKKSEQELGLAARIFESIGEATVITDAENNIVSVNPAFTRITGYAPEEALGKNPRILSSGRHDKEFFRSMWGSINSTGRWQGEIWDRRKSGEIYPKWLSISTIKDNGTGGLRNYVAIFSDITERKEAERRIQYMAHYDMLTGLPNRALLHDRLFQYLNHASRSGKRVALLFLDLDRFKTINDSLGHTAGDLLLQSVAERLKSCLRAEDTVARLGGDEFVVVLPDIQEIEYAAVVAGKILERVAQPHAVGGVELSTTASIGISIYPHDGVDKETLVKNADVAMYKSKEAGRNNYLFFAEDMNASAVERLALENSLRRALERREFVLHFQPQVHSGTGRIVGVEALLRWQHPELGLLMPEQFIPLAEESGLIVEIGEWVLREACEKNRAWQDAGLTAVPVAVNLSALQFRQANLPGIVASALEQSGLQPKYLELELTESSIIRNAEAATNTLRQLKAMGVRLSIDDFGTGYSNLAYLKRYPIDKIKVDQSFVRGMTTDPDDAAIVRAIISMAKSLKLKVIAEGVETREHADFLSANQCDEAQGFHFSKPLPEGEFRNILEAAKITHADAPG